MNSHSDTRDRMVSGATLLMRQHGFTGTSFRDVWESTGTPRGSVYFHFPRGKAELGEAVIQSSLADLLRWTGQAQAEAASAGEFLRGLAARLADFLAASDYARGCPIAAIAIEAPAAFPELRSVASEAFATWSRRIADGLAAFGVAPETAADHARAVVAALEGAIIVSKADRTGDALALTGNLVALGVS
ncbi:MAG: TetR/AcrR family transcriptional regulator [Propionicimonas sp.]|nr:TetR/AcrR family transcriptional regulator [Propionicimonas sp.]